MFESHGHSSHKTGAGWDARCPMHEDHKASLSITEGKDGRILLHCQAGWLHVAWQVLAGEFDGADRSTVESLTIGLRSIAQSRAVSKSKLLLSV